MADRPTRTELLGALARLRQVAEHGEAGEAHSVLVRDPQTGRCHVVGPYRNRLEARVGAMLLRERYVQDDPELADLTYEVVLTFEPPTRRKGDGRG